MNFRSWAYRCLLTVGLSALLIGAAGAATFGTGVVNADGLHIRAEASTEAKVISIAYQGAKVEVLEDAVDGWYKVEYDGKVGYMSAEFLVVTPNDPSAAQESAPAPQSEEAPADLGNGKVTLASGTLNLRSDTSTHSARLASIPNGTVLALEAESDGWYQVTYSGITGFVSSEYIEKTDKAVSTPAAASSFGAAAVALAKQYLGCPYVYGSTGPKGFDCSGFTYFIFKQLGHPISRGGSSQFYEGVSVNRADLQPGDLVFFRDPATSGSKPMSHVGIYIGGNQFIHASSSKRGSGVKVSSLYEDWYAGIYAGARRIV